ncbi:MAG TPA: thioredoxin [Candidatus Dormibacteraeota bacterium]|nr:thioredoxin [Candidatus Dormibacteraeota bacterium]
MEFPERFLSYSRCTSSKQGRSMSKAIQVTTATFEEQVLLAEQPVIVDFYADWCGPCKMLSPVLEQLATEHTDVKITKVNVDEEPALAERYRVRGIPYVAVFRDGKLAQQVVGYKPKAALEAGLGLNGTTA